MDLIYRKILLLAALVVFAVIAPLVVFYAIGYRFSRPTQFPSPVGVVMVDSIPSRATVQVDGHEVGTTPRAVSGLPPGNVHVLVQYPGYLPWKKTMRVEPTLVTESRSIRLWPDMPPRQILASPVNGYVLSPNRHLLAVRLGQRQLAVYDQEGNLVIPAINLAGALDTMLWSPNSAYLLLTSSTSAPQFFDLGNPAHGIQPVPGATGAKQLVWDSRIPARVLALSAAGELTAINLTSGASSRLGSDLAIMAPSSRRLYLAHARGQLTVQTLSGEQSAAISIPGDWQITRLLVTPGDQIAILLADHRLAVRNRDSLFEVIANDVQDTGWSPDGQMLFIQTKPNELYVYNVANEGTSYIPLGQLHLVNRLSRPITHPQWFAGGAHLLYQVDDQLIITEIDTRDYPVSYTVDSTNRSDASAAVGEDGTVLYYLRNMRGRTSLMMSKLILDK